MAYEQNWEEGRTADGKVQKREKLSKYLKKAIGKANARDGERKGIKDKPGKLRN